MKKERKQDIHRKYNFPDSELVARCYGLVRLCIRDRADLLKVGLKDDQWNRLKGLADGFTGIRTDDEYAGDWMVVSTKKDEARQELVNAIRSVMGGVSKSHDPKSGQYRRFGTKRITDMPDAKLFMTGRRVTRVLGQFHGIYQHIKADDTERLNRACTAFEQALNTVEDKNSDRDLATEQRVRLGNELYALMMEIADYGKTAYSASSPVKYNEYLNYESNAEQKRKSRAADEEE